MPLACNDGATCEFAVTFQTGSPKTFGHAGCCQPGTAPCTLFTTCFPSEQQGSPQALSDPRALVCTGSFSQCWTYSWANQGLTSYVCSSASGKDLVFVPSSSRTSYSATSSASVRPTPTQTGASGSPNGDYSGGLSQGAKIGIGVGFGLVGTILLSIVVLICRPVCRSRTRRRRGVIGEVNPAYAAPVEVREWRRANERSGGIPGRAPS